MATSGHPLAWQGLVLLLAFAPVELVAAPAPILASPDSTLDLDGTPVEDHGVVRLEAAGPPTPVDLGTLPHGADVEGIHVEANGDRLFSLDTHAPLGGGLETEPRDVVRFDGSSYALEFDGSARGIPADTGIDAITRVAGQLALSFDTSVILDGVEISDEDLVQVEGAPTTLVLDASSLLDPVPTALDLDGAHWSADGTLLLSFDGSAMFPGFGAHDEDVVALDPTGTWSLALDASAASQPWPAHADLDAVALPEPGLPLALGLGAGLTFRLARTRRSTSRR